MTQNHRSPLERSEYSDDERKSVLSALNKYKIDDAVDLTKNAERIVFAMSHWIFEDETTTSKKRKRDLDRLSNQSCRLKDSINKLPFPVLELLAMELAENFSDQDEPDDEIMAGELLGGIFSAVSMLHSCAEKAFTEEQKESTPSNRVGRPRSAGALVALIRMLEVEWTSRGFKSGFNADKEDRELSGPFCSFVEAAVSPVLQAKKTKDSLSHSIREALKEDYERSGTNA